MFTRICRLSTIPNRYYSSSLLNHRLLDFTTFKAPKELLPHDSSLQIIPEFLTQSEHDLLLQASNEKISRLCRKPRNSEIYEDSHYDKVITGYRECSISSWSLPASNFVSNSTEFTISSLLARAKSFVPEVKRWLAPHLLELADPSLKPSEIRAHVDNLGASGSVIMGICLSSPAIIVFRHTTDPRRVFSALVPERCLYLQRDELRFDYTHEIPMQTHFKGEPVHRNRRVVVLLRDELSDYKERTITNQDHTEQKSISI
ncbi:Alpha-ketoglutarate-dependent dioxygenase alkB 7, mitochondrial [Nowakowskiella sp. JEL0407]|nr:Alpha-ketoglutarate-dependent dioxygenase alkB 7, mitochondrial [Nowakowskiella sp. JEL0407]